MNIEHQPSQPDLLETAPVEPILRVEHVEKRYDGVAALRDVSVDVARGETLAVLGPSGCGKTTLLRVIAGLVVPDTGRVILGGRVLTDGKRVVPAEQRRIGMVFQEGALFPHMTVAENVGYGVRDREIRESRVRAALELVDLRGFEDRYPDTLSGGQAQRVALARALAPKPEVLLLDEPFASLDAELRIRVRSEVARLLRRLGITSIFVTHDQEEAFVIGDNVAVMQAGQVMQIGPPSEIYARPVSPWLARFVGDANILDAAVEGSVAHTAIGTVTVDSPGVAGGERQVLLRPEALEIVPGERGTVEAVEFYGHDTAYTVNVDGEPVTVRLLAAPRFAPGDRVDLLQKGGPAHVFEVGEPAPVQSGEPEAAAASRNSVPVPDHVRPT